MKACTALGRGKERLLLATIWPLTCVREKGERRRKSAKKKIKQPSFQTENHQEISSSNQMDPKIGTEVGTTPFMRVA